MKLRTRIVWITGIAVFLAAVLGNGIIWIRNERTLRNEAFIQGYQESYQIWADFSTLLDRRTDKKIDSVLVEYYFKERRDDYTLCFKHTERVSETGETITGIEEYYNHTIFSPEELLNLNMRGYQATDYAELHWEGRDYLIFRMNMERNIVLLHIVDCTYVGEELRELFLVMTVIILVITVVTIWILTIVLKRAFKPLEDLNQRTTSMAKGLYNQRVEISGSDEIGQLGESFNQMAEAVEARTRSLYESEQRKTLFMGNLTHELKTPMTAISGYAQTLLSTKLSPEDEEEALHYIYKECGRLERLSKKMLKLLELDQEEELELKETPVKVLFEAVEQSCRAIVKEKQIALEITEHGECFPMDLDLMTDCLINFVDNGIKASEPGGKICLKADAHSIEVQDFGQGIPKEEQDKILEPFYMIDKSRSRKSGGAGLGLALAALIIKRHPITLQVESEVGKGTRMILQFV